MAIKEYLNQYTDKVKIFETGKPDVVFETPAKKKIAIEVETGVLLECTPKNFKKKVDELSKNKYDEWFFVVTDGAFAYKYAKFGETYTRKNVAKKLRLYFKDVSSICANEKAENQTKSEAKIMIKKLKDRKIKKHKSKQNRKKAARAKHLKRKKGKQ